MLIVALVLAVIGLAALVTAVVTSNELIAWVCIAASVIGVLLLIVDALRERSEAATTQDAPAERDEGEAQAEFDEDVSRKKPSVARMSREDARPTRSRARRRQARPQQPIDRVANE